MRDRNLPEKRSQLADVPVAVRRVMRGNRSRDTKPERQVRSVLHAVGYRFRNHLRSLPGTPDIVFTARRKVILVHGCFWHGHPGCRLAIVPQTRTEYWLPKLARNRIRDANNAEALDAMGWKAMTVWECELGDLLGVTSRMRAFLGSPSLR
jgi:DNA mismatch endonuclease (patch repair protein)